MKILFLTLILCFIASSVFADNLEDIVKDKYASEIKGVQSMPTSIGLEIEASEIELNNKEPKEILARLLHPYFCGTSGCNTYILINENNAWREINPNFNTHGDLEISPKIVNGFHSIQFGGGKLWNYNGERYE